MGIEMGHLPQGVDPRVGTAGPGHPNRLPGEAGEGLFHHLLYRQGILLALPARVGGPVVLQGQLDPHMGSHTTSTMRAAMDRAVQPSSAEKRSTLSRVLCSPPR